MPQSLALVLVHLVFSTKDRRPMLKEDLRPELYRYLADVVRNAGCDCYRVGGVEDHVHLAIRLSRTVALAGLVETAKTSSSRWMKRHREDFAWQRGYGAFSVGPTDREALLGYIDHQAEHHRKQTFQEEFRAFLKRYGVEFDERYVWD